MFFFKQMLNIDQSVAKSRKKRRLFAGKARDQDADLYIASTASLKGFLVAPLFKNAYY